MFAAASGVFRCVHCVDNKYLGRVVVSETGLVAFGCMDEIEPNMAGLAMFPRQRQWAGVFAADETPPKRGYCVQNTAPRASGGVHWLARADGLVYDSFGRPKYGNFSGDAEHKKNEKCCG